MMTIGEFAALTGLTVRALRFYDEQGVLVPEEVDEWSRYRRYSAEQLTTAIRLSVLRRGGLPLAEVARVLSGEADTATVVSAYRARVEAERVKQDAALANLDALAALEAQSADTAGVRSAVTVEERQAEPCFWAGVVFVIDQDFIARVGAVGSGGEDEIEDPSEIGPRVLTAAGNPPVGRPWMSYRIAGDTAAKLLFCWPLAKPVSDDWSVPGWQVAKGRIEAGPELVAHGPLDTAILEGMLMSPPGVVAILRDAERRGVEVDLGEVRQLMPGPPGDGGEVNHFEVSAPLRRRP